MYKSALSATSAKRTLSFPEHLRIIDAHIANEANSMATLNKYIEQVRHPSSTYSLITDARDQVRRAMRTLEAARMVIASYEEGRV